MFVVVSSIPIEKTQIISSMHSEEEKNDDNNMNPYLL
jgi:hypothetical protein